MLKALVITFAMAAALFAVQWHHTAVNLALSEFTQATLVLQIDELKANQCDYKSKLPSRL
jgi:hypothetical protein